MGKPQMPAFNNGLSPEDRKSIADGLSSFLADSYTLYLKTHNFHWNVTGPMFSELHKMFEEQYNELWTATDEIAERIRALGQHAPGTYREFAKMTSIQEADGLPSSEQMVLQLIEGQEAVVRTARKVFPLAAKVDDQATCDLLTRRLQQHEKTAWMLRALLS